MPKFDLGEFPRTLERIRASAQEEGRLLHNPPDEDLDRLAEKEPEVRRTMYGSLVARSEPTSRAAPFTKNSVDHRFGKAERELLVQVETVLSQKRLISVDRTVGNTASSTVVRLTVPEEFAHVAFGGKNLFLPAKGKVERPDYEIVMFRDSASRRTSRSRFPRKTSRFDWPCSTTAASSR